MSSTSREMGVETFDSIVSDLNYLHWSKCMSWRQISLEPKYKGIPHSTLRDMAMGREPKNIKTRLILKLPALVPVEVCPECGIVHTKKCPRDIPKNRPRKEIWQLVEKEKWRKKLFGE